MKIVVISDTHGQHKDLILPEGDMIIHAGDVSKVGFKDQVKDFVKWFSKLDYKYKIFIAGNHDYFFEKESAEQVKKLIPENVIYLNDSGIEIEGLKIWGSPIQPWFCDWAFNRQRGEEIKKHWDLIPANTNILVVHGPPAGILDETVENISTGCVDLLEKIKIVKPEYFICGHIHEAYGKMEIDGTTFINASVLDENYRMKNKPFVITSQ